jgi:hypothetical protein
MDIFDWNDESQTERNQKIIPSLKALLRQGTIEEG